jgi:hypothetical protein
VKTNKRQPNNKINSKGQVLQNKTDNAHAQIKESASAQKDGFRYDYNDDF